MCSQEESQQWLQNRIVEYVLSDQQYAILEYPKLYCQAEVGVLNVFLRKRKRRIVYSEREQAQLADCRLFLTEIFNWWPET